MSPTGVYPRAPRDARVKNMPRGSRTGMLKVSLYITPADHARLVGAAAADADSVAAYLTRFIGGNIDVIDPDGAA